MTNHQYGDQVKARDNTGNETAYSAIGDAYTAIETPTGITFGTVTSTSIAARSTSTPSGLTRDSSGLYVQNATTGDASGWKQDNGYWISGGLTPNTQYGFRAKARNGDGNETPYCSISYYYTLANVPGPAAFGSVTATSIQANWAAGGNPAGTQYWCENTTTGANSGWTTNLYWNNTGLSCGTSYTYLVRARNADGSLTGFRGPDTQATLTCADPCACDLDTDRDCDMSVYFLFGPDWGRTNCGTLPGSGNPPNDCACDLDFDGDCDMSDYFIFGGDWGRTDCPVP